MHFEHFKLEGFLYETLTTANFKDVPDATTVPFKHSASPDMGVKRNYGRKAAVDEQARGPCLSLCMRSSKRGRERFRTLSLALSIDYIPNRKSGCIMRFTWCSGRLMCIFARIRRSGTMPLLTHPGGRGVSE